MTEINRTLVFIGVAILSALGAWWLQPGYVDPIAEDTSLGGSFYEEFDPLDAASLRVVMYDEETATARQFSVQFKDGLWTIPSHNNYPADGETRLAKTATSMAGITRDEFRSKSAEDHEALGVIDPLSEDEALKGRGDRITLSKEDGSVLVDLVVGKQVRDREGYYYVRHPDENATYVAKLDIDLSTKFADWVETDLLKLNRTELRQIVVHKYSIDEQAQAVKDEEVSELSRPDSTGDWTLAKLDTEIEEVNTENVNEIVNTLDDMKLVGVRVKPSVLRESLKNRQLRVDLQTQIDLQQKGFFITQGGSLLSNEGEMFVSTEKGVTYVLRFGEIFTGSELELEAGIESDSKKTAETADKEDDAKDKEGESDEAKPDEASDAEQSEPAEEESDDAKQGRYLFVMAEYDESLLGPPPTKPVPPAEASEENSEQPAEEKPESPQPDNKKADEPAQGKPNDQAQPDTADSDKDNTTKAEDPCQDEPQEPDEKKAPTKTENAEQSPDLPAKKPAIEPGDAGQENAAPKTNESKEGDQDKPDAGEEGEAKPDPQKEYDEALKKYEEELKEYEGKVEEAKKLVQELNVRFADWYYVISEDTFKKLRLSRADLVKAKEEPKDESKEGTETTNKGEPAVKPESQPKEEPKAEPKDQPKAEPKDQPKAEPKEQPKAEPKEQPKAEPKEQPKAEPKEQPKEEPKDQPKEEPKDQPKEEPKDQPKAEPKDQPKAEPKDQPKEEPKDQPKEEPKDQPKEEPKAA